MVQEKEEHKVQQLAYGTVQPSSLSVEADVASSASPEDWWLSLYRTGSPSVHGRIQCRMVEGEGLQCTAVDVKASAQGRRDWLVDSKALDLQHLRIRRPLSEPSSWIPRGVEAFDFVLDNSAFASYVLGGSNGVLQFGQCSLQLDASPCISHEPRGHVSDITSAQFFPSGAKVVLTTSLDTTLRLWNFDTGSNPRTLQGHTRAVTSAALIPPHGANVISSSLDESIRTWDLSIGNEIDRVNVGAPASQVLLHPSNPDLAFVALRSEHGAVVVVDRVLGQITQRLEDTKAPINSIALANDGSALLAGDHSGVCTLWDVSSLGKLFMRCQWTRTDAPVLCVSPTDEPLAWLVAGADGLPYRVNVKDSGMVELSEELGCATAEEAETTSVVSLKGDVVGVAGGKGVVFYR